MSVALMISNPITDEEDKYYIPISTEKTFEDYWNPIIEQLNLRWAKYFQIGVEIEKQNLDEVIKELKEIENWIITNWITKYVNTKISNEIRELMLERLENLEKELTKIFNSSRSDIKIYIG